MYTYVIGASVESRLMTVVRLTGATPGTVPAVKLIGNIHGNDVIGEEGMRKSEWE